MFKGKLHGINRVIRSWHVEDGIIRYKKTNKQTNKNERKTKQQQQTTWMHDVTECKDEKFTGSLLLI
jgi:hypothetical protein